MRITVVLKMEVFNLFSIIFQQWNDMATGRISCGIRRISAAETGSAYCAQSDALHYHFP